MAPFGLPLLALIPATSAFSHLSTGSLDPNNVLCPVLVALYTSGVLKVDSFGHIERAEIKSVLKNATWCSDDLAELQSVGIADYDWTHKHDMQYRDRCVPGLTLSGTGCWNKRLIHSKDKDAKRYLPMFNMNGLEAVEHGISTGVRGGNCNSPIENDICGGQYPCEALFQKFYVAHADSRGRLYVKQILEIICHAYAEGDRSGEFSYYDGEVNVVGVSIGKVPATVWQMKAAMIGWVTAFGRLDEHNELYMSVDDARAMLMESRVPDDWQKRHWGCVTPLPGLCPKMPNGKHDKTFIDAVNIKLPCDETAAWWQGLSFTTTTGQSCHSDRNCNDPHALCLSRRCTCSKGSNGRQMLFTGGRCTEQLTSPRQYNGQSCQPVKANNPDSPTWGNSLTWQAEVIV